MLPPLENLNETQHMPGEPLVEKHDPIDLQGKVADLTVEQLFRLLDACVNKAVHEVVGAIVSGKPVSKIIKPNFTPQSANRFARRHPDHE